MIEAFPLLQQPLGSNSCFPTAVRAVLLWHGVEISPQTISDLCGEGVLGCDLETAIPSLREEYDVEELRGDIQALRETISNEDDPQPAIVILKYSADSLLDHAVVLLGIQLQRDEIRSYEVVEFMD